MSISFPKVKGFKKDKRNLIESTNNLCVLGQGQKPLDATGSKGRRPFRRGTNIRQRRSSSKAKSILPSGPYSTTQKLDRLVQKVDLTGYFSNTKPWNDASNKKSSHNDFSSTQLQKDSKADEISAVGATASELASVLSRQRTDIPPLLTQPSAVASSNNAGGPFSIIPEKWMAMMFVNDIVCPVCLKGFEPLTYSKVPVSDVMKHSLAAYQYQNSAGVVFKKNLEDGWGTTAKPKCILDPQDVVVAANCGELFHRLCLRDWCSRGHRKSPHGYKPTANCPSCNKELKYTMCQEIEMIRCFSRDPTKLNKEFNKVKHINRELQILWPETNNYLARIKTEIQDTETLYQQLRSQRRGVKTELKKLTAEDLSVVMANVTDSITLNASLTKQEKALEFMQQETLQIMRMYLLTIIRKLKESTIPMPDSGDFTSLPGYTSLIGRIPVALVPFLQDIVNDNQALSMLSRILAPYRGDEKDPSQQKYLELEIIQKFSSQKSASVTIRPNTYVVTSSAPEVGDSESDESIAKKAPSFASFADAKKDVASSLKASVATHGIATIPSNIKTKSLLQLSALSNMSVACREKPPQLLKVLEIAFSQSTVNSSLLHEHLTEIRNLSPNGGGSVDKAFSTVGDPTSPSLSSPSSNLSAADWGASSEFQTSKGNLESTMSFDEASRHYEQDSRYVRAIRQLMQSKPTKLHTRLKAKAPPVTPATGCSSMVSQSVPQTVREIPGPAANTEELPTYSEKSQQASAANSEAAHINKMVVAFMRKHQHMCISSPGQTGESLYNVGPEQSYVATFDESKVLPPSSTNRSQSPPKKSPNKPSTKRDEKDILKNTGKDYSWQTITSEEDDEDSKSESDTHSTQKLALANKTKLPSNEEKNRNRNLEEIQKPVGSIDSVGAYPVYTPGYYENELSSTNGNVNQSVKIPPKNLDEVSIAIMYVIEEDNEDEKRPEQQQTKGAEKSVATDDEDMLQLPPPRRTLSPIYLTAEKSSNFSIIAHKPPASTPPEAASLMEMWPFQSRMIPAEVQSDINTVWSNEDMGINRRSCCDIKAKNCDHPLKNNIRLKKQNSGMSLFLPPLPLAGEIVREQKNLVPESVFPTIFYENETTGQINCSSNKKMAGS